MLVWPRPGGLPARLVLLLEGDCPSVNFGGYCSRPCCWAAKANDALVLLLMVVLLLLALLLLRSPAMSCTAGALGDAPGFGSMLLLPEAVTAARKPACDVRVREEP